MIVSAVLFLVIIDSALDVVILGLIELGKIKMSAL